MTTLLLIEDNETLRNMLCRRLSRKGYEVDFACNGREGISAAFNQQPDLILMDLSLPEVDGWKAAQLLKAKQATRHIPIIALTANAMNDDRDKALEAGCDEYETKPVDFLRLVAKIEQILNVGVMP